MNNNEQDMILKEKIEKREKFDTILAYILLVVLIGGIILVLCLKFLRKEDDVKLEEYVPTYISLNEMASLLNSSTLANRYANDGVSFSANVSGNSLIIDYVKDDVNLSFNTYMVGGELLFSYSIDNSVIAQDIYKEIANIVCVHYGNEERYCRNTLIEYSQNGNDGMRIVKNGDTVSVYINTTKSFTVNKEIIYTGTEPLKLEETEYSFKFDDIFVYNVIISTSDSNVLLTANIDRLSNDTSNVAVVVKLYNEDGKVLAEKRYEYKEDKPLVVTSSFKMEFLDSASLKVADVDKYSIEIIK